MPSSFSAKASIHIHTSPVKVWETLTDPEKIKLFLYGTHTETDWKKGSSIKFSGNFNETEHHDKGNVIENVPYSLLKYNYWSSMSGIEDILENYFEVSYLLEKINETETVLTWNQSNIHSEKSAQHTQQGLPDMLNVIKKIAESQ